MSKGDHKIKPGDRVMGHIADLGDIHNSGSLDVVKISLNQADTSVKKILQQHNAYSQSLELCLLRYFDKLRIELLQEPVMPPPKLTAEKRKPPLFKDEAGNFLKKLKKD